MGEYYSLSHHFRDRAAPGDRCCCPANGGATLRRSERAMWKQVESHRPLDPEVRWCGSESGPAGYSTNFPAQSHPLHLAPYYCYFYFSGLNR